MKKEVQIGLFTIFVILAAWFGVRFLKGVDIFSNTNDYYVRYEQADGVQQSASVYVRGVKIGNVSQITLDPTQDGGVTLCLSISKQYDIPIDSKAEIFSGGLMSSKAISLTWGSSEEYLKSGDMITSAASQGLMEMATTQLDSLKEQLEGVTTGLTTTLTSINTLIDGNSEHISGVVRNLDALTLTLGRLIENNEESVTNVMGGLSETLTENRANIDSIILNINTLTAELSKMEVSESFTKSLQEVTSLLGKINSEDGNINKILSDDKLYENITSASGSLDSLLVDLRENPARYVHFSLFERDKSKKAAKAEKKRAKAEKHEAKR